MVIQYCLANWGEGMGNPRVLCYAMLREKRDVLYSKMIGWIVLDIEYTAT